MTDKFTFLIVEDNQTSLMLMEKMLTRYLPDCDILSYASPATLLAELPRLSFDIGIIDFQMPDMNGVQLIEAIRSDRRFAGKPFVMVTADRDAQTRMAAINAGAIDFLLKPIEPVEFKARIQNLMWLCEAQRKLANQADWLRAEVEKATMELRRREEEIIGCLTLAAGYKDVETTAHAARMAHYCAILARRLGFDDDACRDIRLAAPMHDIGKVGIRDDILQKQDGLSPSERQHMNEHARIGGSILGGSSCDLLQLAAQIAKTHHERWDGTGYPSGLKGDEIPLVGRIAAVADVFDALTTERPYKAAWTMEQAFAYLRQEAGKQFDPRCVETFVEAAAEIRAAKAKHPDEPGLRRRIA